MTNSVPLIEAARGDARKAIRFATSAGVDGSERYAADRIHNDLFASFVVRLKLYPKVSVDLVTEGRLVGIVAEGFDLGLRAASLVPSDMIAIRLACRNDTP
jgi:DNA-binding transcriptional LysR family regulator